MSNKNPSCGIVIAEPSKFQGQAENVSSSAVFKYYKKIGCHSSNISVHVSSRSSRSILGCAVGHSYQILDAYTLKYILESAKIPQKINSIVVDDEDAYIAAGENVYLFKRGQQNLVVEICKYANSSNSHIYVYTLNLMGNLIMCHCSDNRIRFLSKIDLGDY